MKKLVVAAIFSYVYSMCCAHYARVNNHTKRVKQTPAQITLTHEQLQALADTGQTCIIQETLTLVSPVEAWVLGEEDVPPDQHRTLIVEGDGTILSDTVLDDSC